MHPAVKTRRRLSLVLLLSLFLPAACRPVPAPVETETPAPPAALPVQEAPPDLPINVPDEAPLRLSIIERNEVLTDPAAVINLRVPRLDGPAEAAAAFNNLVDQMLKGETDGFKASLAEWEPAEGMPPVPSTFVSGYSVYYAGERLVSLKLEFIIYITGAAHPFSYVRTLNFDLAQGAEVKLDEVFTPGADYLAFLSDTCSRELSGRLGDAFFPEGVTPQEDNFQSWGLSPEGLWIEFDPYQAAPYSEGPQQVAIPFGGMEGWVKRGGPADWVAAPRIEVEEDDVPPLWPTPLPVD